jgi:hypothetical protein
LNTLDYIVNRFDLETWRSEAMPISLPGMGDREGLADLFRELGFKVGVEIGVERGRFSVVLLDHNPDLILYGVDPWTTYDNYPDYPDQAQLDFFMQATKDRLTKHKVIDRFRLIRKFSTDAVKDFKDGSLDFVYIDGNHDLLNVVRDIVEWEPKVRSGGIVGGHDYHPRRNTPQQVIHVMEGVKAYTDSYEIRPWFVVSGIKAKQGSFLWVKK